MKIFLTAPPQTGKSTVIESFIEQYQGGKRGILAREMLDENGSRIGFTSINCQGQSRQFMSRVSGNGLGTYRGKTGSALKDQHEDNIEDNREDRFVGNFAVDVAAIDAFVVPEILQSLESIDTLVYLDEIGRAQANSTDFIKAVRLLLEAKNSTLASIVFKDDPWSMEFKNHPAVCLLEVSASNRNYLPAILLKAFDQATAFKQLRREQQLLVYAFLKQFLEAGHFYSAQKLFSNALGYVVANQIQLIKEDTSISYYQVAGQSRSHQISFHRDNNSFICDCDLANGRGDFAGAPQTCSHEMSIRIANLLQSRL